MPKITKTTDLRNHIAQAHAQLTGILTTLDPIIQAGSTTPEQRANLEAAWLAQLNAAALEIATARLLLTKPGASQP